MIFIKLEGKMNLDSALKQLKSKFIKHKVSQELNERKTYKKKSEARREQVRKASYIQRKKSESDK